MNQKQNTPIATRDNDAKREPYEQIPDEAVQNPNPRANENIRVRTNEPQTQGKEPTRGIGSETTDGEDA
jgi:hypothetical protein